LLDDDSSTHHLPRELKLLIFGDIFYASPFVAG
jgi:hypothetical protein